MVKLTGAEALVQQLQKEKVTTIFGLPGFQIMEVFDALYGARDKIQLIHTRHEQATSFMADGYAKVTGKPGVALVVPGPGALNASAGIGTAYASSSPVLLISGQIPRASLGLRKGETHEIEDQLDSFRAITKWNHRVEKVAEIPTAVNEAIRQLKSGRPRPVELEVPFDLFKDSSEVALIEPAVLPANRAQTSDITRAVDMLIKSKNPTIIAGGGAIIANATTELTNLAEFFQAPVITTQNGKGIIPETHHLSVGVNYYTLGPSKLVGPNCDVILAVGTRLLSDLHINSSTKIIHIDIDASEIARNYPTQTEISIVSDAKNALAQMLQQAQRLDHPKPSRTKEVNQYRTQFKKEIRLYAPEQMSIIDTLRSELNDDAIVVSGITNIGYWSHLGYPVSHPRSYITSSYFATLGFSFPTALGAKVAHPDRQVVAISGDGGFMYSFQELSTAVKYGINVIILLFNNNAYGASEWDQTHRYNKHYLGTDLHNPNFVKLANSFGVQAIRTDSNGFKSGLRKALKVDAPVLLEVTIPTMMPPFQIVQ